MSGELVDPPNGWHWEKRASRFFDDGRPCVLDVLLVENGRRTTPEGLYVLEPGRSPYPAEPYYRRGVAVAWQARGVSRAIVKEWRRDERLQRRYRRFTS